MVAQPIEQWLPGMDITAGRLESMNQKSWYMVTNYGADPSGVANSDAAIQLALNDARDRGGAWVMVPPGTYLIGATLRIYANTRLTLAAGAEFRRNHGGTMMLNGDAGQAYGGYTGNGNITIEGGLWNMRATTPGMTGNAMCISIGHAAHVTIRDLEVRDLPGFHGIELNSTKHAQIINCTFRGYVDPGGRASSEAIQLDLAKDSASFGGFGPYDQTPCEDVVVRDCYFGASDTPGTIAWPRGVGSHSGTVGRWHRRIHVVDNMFEGLSAHAIRAYSWEDAVIMGNTMRACGAGIAVRVLDTSRPNDTLNTSGVQTNASQTAWGYVIANNNMRDGGSLNEQIIVEGETTGRAVLVAITGNVIRGSSGGQNGIRVMWAYRVTITGNVTHGVAGTGISLYNVQGAAVSGNRIHDCIGSGITMDTCTEMVITGNNVTTVGGNGLYSISSTYVKWSNNFVRGAGNAGDSASAGYRVSTSADRITITGNTYVKAGSGTEAPFALNISPTSATNIRRYGNDWLGQGTVTDASISPNLSPLDSGA